MRLKSGKEKRLESGKELAVAAPIMAKAAKDTAIAGPRFEAPGSAASGLPPVSGVSATCVPYVSTSQDFSSPPISKTRRSRHLGRSRLRRSGSDSRAMALPKPAEIMGLYG